MLFNSIEFIVFFPIVFSCYWFLKKALYQNIFLTIASYVFYGWWDWRFLCLIAFSSGLNYILALKIDHSNNQRTRKLLLAASIIANIGILGFFKYFNFFIDSFSLLLGSFNISTNYSSLNIILPLGISFYTFQTLSYTIDIYRKKIPAVANPITFFTYVSFFPQLVAGPIERATNLIPQFVNKRTFSPELATDGLRQILWGLMKKVVIADNCALLVSQIFDSPSDTHSGILILGTILFAFQIYGDFSGYSDIAIGTSKLLGIKLMTNFRYPYFSQNMSEFWQRWHISLSTWFRDYVYIPLGGNRHGKLITVRNMTIVFLISGLWHGANWTFVVWGAIHALLYIPIVLTVKPVAGSTLKLKSRWRIFFNTLLTFSAVCITWVFFRAESLTHALQYFAHIFQGSNTPNSQFIYFIKDTAKTTLIIIIVMTTIEWFQRNKEHGLEISNIKHPAVRYLIYYLLIYVIWRYAGEQQDFIYFQF
ncbi:MAG: alginate O-acetyltransferase complex protein AlgI [Rubritalea sp.]|jgi:alginate O-acetyltransferase complex protein AlgI|tara:strand:- start:5115 stop:6548 length:1434 start_codon:yes stop_codon:yes gene_type:complete